MLSTWKTDDGRRFVAFLGLVTIALTNTKYLLYTDDKQRVWRPLFGHSSRVLRRSWRKPPGMKMAKASLAEVDEVWTAIDTLVELQEKDESAWGYADLEAFEDAVNTLSIGQGRVVFGMRTLLENCCDPEAKTLRYREDIRQGLWLRSRLMWSIKLMNRFGFRPWNSDGE